MAKTNTAVIYRSILGTTEQYAKWLAEDINADIFKFKEIDKSRIGEYKKYVIASGSYLAGLRSLNFSKNFGLKSATKVLLSLPSQ